MGPAEIGVIIVVGLLVFGPEKLPAMAKQAGQMVRTVRRMAETAKNDLGREMGHDLSGVDLRELDPREVVRRTFMDEPSAGTPQTSDRILRPGERPPFDTEAT